jgi:hypothetical protein
VAPSDGWWFCLVLPPRMSHQECVVDLEGEG